MNRHLSHVAGRKAALPPGQIKVSLQLSRRMSGRPYILDYSALAQFIGSLALANPVPAC